MEIKTSEAGQVVVVVPGSDLDAAVAPRLKQAVGELIDAGRVRLVLDLGRVGYIDSSGLGVLVMAMRRARMAGGDIKLCALQPDVRSLLEMTRMVKALDVYATREAAVAAWG